MVVIKTSFDGEKGLVPESLRGRAPGEVILIYDAPPTGIENEGWLQAQEQERRGVTTRARSMIGYKATH